jgi:DNA-binding response OmpR family regulator
MARPTLLIAEPEPLQALSARKLVLETAKFNVVTAHSGRETLDLFSKFPAVDGVIVHSELRDGCPADIFRSVKETNAQKPTILLMSGAARSRKDADYTIASDEPDTLLKLVRRLFGDPRPYDSESASL